MAVLRQVHLTISVLGELATASAAMSEKEGEEVEEVFIVDQLAACVPMLKLLGEHASRGRQRILFYCHFPDQLLARRDERNTFLRLAKGIYRYPFDWFEGWAVSAADRVVANSRFTRGVVGSVFKGDALGDVSVIYPCVDTAEKEKRIGEEGVDGGELWGGKKILLSINRFERKKDMGLAIRAYHGLGEERRKGTRLVVAGMFFSCYYLRMRC